MFSVWFKAVQGLMACSLASTMLALIIGLFSLCCECKGCNPNMAAGAFANLTCKYITKIAENSFFFLAHLCSEHNVFMVSYCDGPVFVVVCRPSSTISLNNRMPSCKQTSQKWFLGGTLSGLFKKLNAMVTNRKNPIIFLSETTRPKA